MRRSLLCVAILLIGVCHLDAADRIDLRVLYAGNPGSSRMAEFEAFLNQHFTHVAVTDTSHFQESEADGHDVVIFDWTRIWDDTGKLFLDRRIQDPPRLSREFDRPAILIGETGARLTAFLDLKLNNLCVCLYDSAHHLAVDHELFHKPLAVNPKFEEVPTDEEFPYMSLDDFGPTMEVWKPQTKNYPQVDVGLVHTLYGFEDSPDAEVFARGISMKGPDTVAISRQANYFQWGFAVSPPDMTPAARRLFVNAVCYIDRFDGVRPLVPKTADSRKWALRYAKFPNYLSETYQELYARKTRQQLAVAPGMMPERFEGDVDEYIQVFLDAKKDVIKDILPVELRETFGMDAEKYQEYYTENLEYLIPRDSTFVVDEDVKGLGMSNRDPALLDRCIEMLESREQSELALRILKRYTNEKFESAGEWRDWLESNRANLFFTDAGGYKFMVAPHEAGS